MRRLALIANPMAGALSAPAWVERARRELWGYEIESFLPSSIEELQTLPGEKRLRLPYTKRTAIRDLLLK